MTGLLLLYRAWAEPAMPSNSTVQIIISGFAMPKAEACKKLIT